jgi:hypothetical protein
MVIIALLVGKQRANEVGRKGDKVIEKRAENAARQQKCEVDDTVVADVGGGDATADDLEDVPFSKVVAIENGTKGREFTGTLDSGDAGDRNMMFKPRDKRVPLIMVPKEYIPKELMEDPTLMKENLFKVSIIKWNCESRVPLGMHFYSNITRSISWKSWSNRCSTSRIHLPFD